MKVYKLKVVLSDQTAIDLRNTYVSLTMDDILESLMRGGKQYDIKVVDIEEEESYDKLLPK